MEVIAIYPICNFGGIEILDINYDTNKVKYRISGQTKIEEADIIEKCDGVYIDALGFMFGEEFIPFHDIMLV